MTAEEQKGWEGRVGDARERAVAYGTQMISGDDMLFLSADAVIQRAGDVDNMTKAIMAKYIDEGFKRVDFRENECFLAATAVSAFIKEG